MQGKLHYHPHRTLAILMPTNSSCTLDTQEKCHTHCSTYRSATIKKPLRTPLCRNSYPNFILDTLNYWINFCHLLGVGGSSTHSNLSIAPKTIFSLSRSHFFPKIHILLQCSRIFSWGIHKIWKYFIIRNEIIPIFGKTTSIYWKLHIYIYIYIYIHI